ncbi:MAG: hypothetical protein GC131_06965 [Alphaproteobacteria bacterium]|nr:hypothetical protein [Alphaproteobacteria bacterium]
MMVATKATINERALVALFRDSNPPTVWRMDLDKNHSFAVAIQGKEGEWELGIMSSRGEFTVVARFATREEVDTAFACVQRALMSSPSSLLNKVIRTAAITATITVILLIGAVALNGVSSGDAGGKIGVAQIQPGQVALPAPTPSGIPLSADEVLQAP